jgi:hypothetical protein
MVLAIGITTFIGHGSDLARAAKPAVALQVAQLAPNGAPGIVNSVNLGPVDPEAPITVRPLDDSRESLEIKRRFDGALRQAGYAVSDYVAATELSFETEVIEGRFSGDGRNFGRFEGNSDRGINLQLNLWSNAKDSVLGGRQKKVDRQANVYHMNAVLRNRETGKTLWQGDAFCEMLTPDIERIAASMIPPLVRSLGRSVEGETFNIE